LVIKGYRVGQIRHIQEIERDGRLRFQVDVNVKRGWRIPEDSRAAITSGLFAAAVIDIQGGESTTMLEPGSEIPADETADVFANLNKAASQTVELLENRVQPLLETISGRAPDIVDNVEQLLDTGARAYVNHPRGASVTKGKLKVSSIYEWFQSDFGGNDAGVIGHLRQYADAPLTESLKDIRKVSDDDYDWRLNDVDR